MPNALWVGNKPTTDQILELPQYIRTGLVLHTTESPGVTHLLFSGDMSAYVVLDTAQKNPDVEVWVWEAQQWIRMR